LRYQETGVTSGRQDQESISQTGQTIQFVQDNVDVLERVLITDATVVRTRLAEELGMSFGDSDRCPEFV
jgi:hypothetical protein